MLCLLLVKTLTSWGHVCLCDYILDLPFILLSARNKFVRYSTVLSPNQTGRNCLNCSTHRKEIFKRWMEELLWLRYLISQFLALKKMKTRCILYPSESETGINRWCAITSNLCFRLNRTGNKDSVISFVISFLGSITFLYTTRIRILDPV